MTEMVRHANKKRKGKTTDAFKGTGKDAERF